MEENVDLKTCTSTRSFAVVNNIPSCYHSCDLRNFFSEFIETDCFSCFHFKHRPEVVMSERNNDVADVVKPSTSNLKVTISNGHTSSIDSKDGKDKKASCCCVVKLASATHLNNFIKKYHKKYWLDRQGEPMPALCSIKRISIQQGLTDSQRYKTKREMRKIPEDRESVTEQDLLSMPEQNPPTDVMPFGNVGTPTKVFLELIKQCKLPPKVIAKLGLTFPKSRSKHRYGNVPFDYPDKSFRLENQNQTMKESVSKSCYSADITKDIECEESVRSASGHEIVGEGTDILLRAAKESSDSNEQKATDEASDTSSLQDADECEEWERHEALHDDPANVERNKERVFEEEIELKWEKGGSGLVFYTDAQFWRAKEGDFDEQTADDWDVDMSVYYEDNGGDRDSRDLVAMRQSKRRREGIEATDLKTIGFHKDSASDKVGSFEKYTKGIGHKVLRRQGWTEGQGLGSSTSGIAEAIESDGQHPADKRGLGFYGDKLDRLTSSAKRKRKGAVISTIYDNTAELDPPEPLLRRNEPYHLKHRDVTAPYQAFQRPSDPQLQVLQ